MLLNAVRAFGFSAQPAGFADMSMLDPGPMEGIIAAGPIDGAYLLREVGRGEVSRLLGQGTLIPEGCEQHHQKIVLYGAIFCFSCGWLA